MDLFIAILIITLLIMLSAFFSGGELALMSMDMVGLEDRAGRGDRLARIQLTMRQRPQRTLGTILIGNNVVNIWSSVMATTVAQQTFGNQIIGYVVGVMTFVILVFGEIIPKTLAHRFKIVFAQAASPILYALKFLLYPIIILLEYVTKAFVWLLGREKFKTVTEDEVIALLNIGHEEGEFNKQENEFIRNIFEFSDTTAEEIMVNRNEIEGFLHTLTIEKALKMINKSTHSRIPVYENTIDNIIGYITLKDLLKYSCSKRYLKKKLDEVKLQQPLLFPVTKPINEIFRTFQKKRTHIGIILDEFGATAGLITLEDILEEIVGDIIDETDQEDEGISEISKNMYTMPGNTSLEEIWEVFHFETEIAPHKTVAYLIIHQLGAFPRQGEKIFLSAEGIEFVVEKMLGKTIQRVKMEIKSNNKKK